MSKDLAFEYNEAVAQEVNNPQEMEEQYTDEQKRYFDFIVKMQKKEVVLSYSSLKKFAESPLNFVRYKLEEKAEPTESMLFGSLCDLLVTQPQRFDQEFIILDITPTTDKQAGFCEEVIKGTDIETAFAKHYAKGKAIDLYEALKPYIEARLSGKKCISQGTYDQARAVTDNLMKSELISTMINTCTDFQQKVEWEFGGWKFVGFKDCSAEGLIIDLKYTKDANPDRFERDIISMDYYLQLAMYTMAEGYDGIPECYIIAYDKSMNYSLIKIDYSLIVYGIRKFKYLVHKISQCAKENRWNESYNFFDERQRTIYKPNWVKGFPTDPEEC
ncbi:PD-(D/E)XK nuclease-like domain-containing protein [Capnocytophaga canis]|uniref:PD-(D/E)XK nuclease-like domain-containing protein n=1 Tax=Capnocytophaga canis TaxID=1848903 RepID=UPI0037CD2325